MKLPFPMHILNADIKVYSEELSEDGEPVLTVFFDGRAQYVMKSRQVLNAQRELVMLTGWVVIPGDITEVADVSEETPLFVEVKGIKKRVFSVNKPDNPDGTVFSTELFLT